MRRARIAFYFKRSRFTKGVDIQFGGIGLLISCVPLHTIWILLIQVLVGGITYILGARLLKIDSLDAVLRMVKR